MAAPINVVFISISGNTRAFTKLLQQHAVKAQAMDADARDVNFYEYTEQFDERVLDAGPYFVLVPTYLDGGDGMHTGYQETLTVDLRDELDDGNTDNLIGIVGSGNRNFNAQFGLTAKHYANRYNSPLVGLFELRGNKEEAQRIYDAMSTTLTEYERTGVKKTLTRA